MTQIAHSNSPDSAPAYHPDYAFSEAPAPGAVIEVADGVQWLRMPLPFALDHINLWALADGDGWLLVDTGIQRDETKELWGKLVGGPLRSMPPRRLLCTHFHPDHFGLAGWLCDEYDLPLTMTRGEWTMGTMLRLDADAAFNESMAAFFLRHGLAAELAAPLGQRGNVYATRVAMPPLSYRRIADDDEIEIGGRCWRVIVGTGHAPEHACLYCAELGVLISGDQILPRITSNVSVWASEPEADPLAEFLDSLGRFRDLPADTLVLPSHGLPFRGLHGRLDDLIQHHDARLGEVVDGCRDWRSAADILPVLFRRPLDGHQIVFAMGESIAHLSHLARRGLIECSTNDEGIVRYRAV
ncbi:MAG: MBL fold metallo-hydrolase [Alphaproteobacteria bacterium]|nr:MBL fold metallo-hydrolase [Alphaproteobacteria bacterium]